MKKSGATHSQSATELISKRIVELEDWPSEYAQLAAVFSGRVCSPRAAPISCPGRLRSARWRSAKEPLCYGEVRED